MPHGSFIPEQELPVSKPKLAFGTAIIMFILYGGLGFIGLKLVNKLGFADVWDTNVTNKQRFLFPALIGIGTLDDAAQRAADNMFEFLKERLPLAKNQLAMLMGLICDLQISQVVDPEKTACMRVDKEALAKYDLKF